MPGKARRDDAVKYVYAASDPFDQVVGFAYAHQVTGLAYGQAWHSLIQRRVHFRLGLAHSQAPNRIPLKI